MTVQVETFLDAGFDLIDPPVLQPADPFLDLSGEDIRRRIYVFADPTGKELCLRPDLTIPTCLHYLRDPNGGEQRYCYDGLAFRCQDTGSEKPNEFAQSGIEHIGGAASPGADAEIFSLTLNACRTAGLRDFTVQLGDPGLFATFVGALDIPSHWRHKLQMSFAQPSRFGALLRSLTGERPDSEGVAALLGKLDEESAAETVAGLLDIAGLTDIPGRSLDAVTRRLIEKARDAQAEPLSRDIIEVIESYLSLQGAPKEVLDEIDALAARSGADMTAILKEARQRTELIEAELEGEQIEFSTEFGRSFDYYTGFIFELTVGDTPVAGGGRYDDLLERLGASSAIAAVGAMIRNDRLVVAAREGTVA